MPRIPNCINFWLGTPTHPIANPVKIWKGTFRMHLLPLFLLFSCHLFLKMFFFRLKVCTLWFYVKCCWGFKGSKHSFQRDSGQKIYFRPFFFEGIKPYLMYAASNLCILTFCSLGNLLVLSQASYMLVWWLEELLDRHKWPHHWKL